MRKLSLLWSLIVGALFVVGCGPETPDGPNPPVTGTTPEITIEQNSVEFNSFTFDVTTTVPGELGYVVVAEGYDAPKMNEWFNANTAEVNDKATITVDGLNDNLNYTLYAVLRAKADGVLSSPKSLKFTTPDDGVTSPITVDYVSYDTIKFTINIEGSYVFQCIDKAFLEHMNQTPESYIATEGIGIPSKGSQMVEWVDGGKFGNYDMHVREDSDYYIIVAITNGSEITSQIFVEETRTPKKPTSEAGLTTELKDITSTQVTIATTPDDTVVSYYVWVETKQKIEYYVQVGGSESFLSSLIKNVNSGSWVLSEANEQTWTGLIPDTDYYCILHVIDNSGAEALSKIEFRTTQKQLGEPTAEVDMSPASSDPHNTLSLNIFSEDAAYVKVAFNTKADINEYRNQDMTDSDIAEKKGVSLSADDIEAINTTGLSVIFEDLWPETEYIAVASIKNVEGTEIIKCASCKTPKREVPQRVESDLFESLLGEWEVSYSLVQFNRQSVDIVNEKVTIAAGADAKSSSEYREYNRLVILDWPFSVSSQGEFQDIPYMSPDDLKEASSYWRNNESLAYRDYGAKIFLEIGANDTITIPSDRSTYLYNWGDDGYTLYFYGADYDNAMSAPATFPVTLSADGNTLTIGACYSGEEFGYGVYRPSVFRENEMWAVATSDIVLKRVN